MNFTTFSGPFNETSSEDGLDLPLCEWFLLCRFYAEVDWYWANLGGLWMLIITAVMDEWWVTEQILEQFKQLSLSVSNHWTGKMNWNGGMGIWNGQWDFHVQQTIAIQYSCLDVLHHPFHSPVHCANYIHPLCLSPGKNQEHCILSKLQTGNWIFIFHIWPFHTA